MLMKVKSILLIASCIMMQLFSSCSDMSDEVQLQKAESIVLTPEEYASVAYDSTGTMSPQEAVEMVHNFCLQNSTRSAVLPTVVSQRELSDTISLQGKTKEVTIPTYELSFGNEGGYAIVSADERAPEVIAYSTTGKISDISENVGAMKMQRMSERVILTQIAQLDLLRDSLREKTLNKIASQLNVNKVDFNSIKDRVLVNSEIQGTRSKQMYPDESKAWKSKLPMLKTSWAQWYPYNIQLGKAKNPTIYANKGYNAVGCAGVAAAQIVAFYKAISVANGCTLNWNEILSEPFVDEYSDDGVIEQVSQLMKCVANGIKTEWTDKDDAGTSNISKVHDYFDTINLTFDIRKKGKGYAMDATRIITSLDQGYPVFVTGNDAGNSFGHLWILDGYLMLKKDSKTRMQIMTNDTYIHANFGWDGLYDGYYLVDSGTTNLTFQNQCDFSSGMMLYPNVRRK